MLWRIRALPPAREASAVMDGLDSGPRLVAAGRAFISALTPLPDTPLEIADKVMDWVAAEAAGFRAGAAAQRAGLAVAPRDGLLVVLAVAPAVALFAPG